MAAATPPRSLQTVVCAGDSPFEVGRAHGSALQDAITSALATVAADRATRGLSAAAFLAKTGHLEAMQRHTPELVDELRGIAAGSGADFDNIVALSLMDEEWTWARRVAAGAPGCTAIGLPGYAGVAAVLDQTMDLPVVHDGSQAVVELRLGGRPGSPGTSRCWVVTIAGQLGLMGANATGLGVVVNNLSTLPTSADGLPVAAVLRGLLGRCENVAAAGAFLTSVPHATGQAYTVGDAAGRIRCWEADARGVVDVSGEAHTVVHSAALLVHANHPICRKPDPAAWPTEAAEALYARTRSLERSACALDSLARVPEALRPGRSPAAAAEAVQAALCCPPVSVGVAAGASRGVFTFAACVFELSVPPRISDAGGPPASGDDFERVAPGAVTHAELGAAQAPR